MVYEAKRAEVHERFAGLIRGYLDEAVAEGAIAPLDTRVATLAWLGAVNEIVVQWLHAGSPDPRREPSPPSPACSCAPSGAARRSRPRSARRSRVTPRRR